MSDVKQKLFDDIDKALNENKKGVKEYLLDLLYDKIIDLKQKGYTNPEITKILNKTIIKNKDILNIKIGNKARKVLNASDIKKYLQSKNRENNKTNTIKNQVKTQNKINQKVNNQVQKESASNNNTNSINIDKKDLKETDTFSYDLISDEINEFKR